MYNNVCIVHCHPIAVAQTVYCQGACSANLTGLVANTHGQSMNLSGAATLRNHKVCAYGIFYAAEVYNYYIVALLVLNAIDDGIEQLMFSCFIHYIYIIEPQRYDF